MTNHMEGEQEKAHSAEYHNRHNSTNTYCISAETIRGNTVYEWSTCPFAKIIPPKGGSFWQKNSFITHFYWIMPIMIFNRVYFFLVHPLVSYLYEMQFGLFWNPCHPWECMESGMNIILVKIPSVNLKPHNKKPLSTLLIFHKNAN